MIYNLERNEYIYEVCVLYNTYMYKLQNLYGLSLEMMERKSSVGHTRACVYVCIGRAICCSVGPAVRYPEVLGQSLIIPMVAI